MEAWYYECVTGSMMAKYWSTYYIDGCRVSLAHSMELRVEGRRRAVSILAGMDIVVDNGVDFDAHPKLVCQLFRVT